MHASSRLPLVYANDLPSPPPHHHHHHFALPHLRRVIFCRLLASCSTTRIFILLSSSSFLSPFRFLFWSFLRVQYRTLVISHCAFLNESPGLFPSLSPSLPIGRTHTQTRLRQQQHLIIDSAFHRLPAHTHTTTPLRIRSQAKRHRSSHAHAHTSAPTPPCSMSWFLVCVPASRSGFPARSTP